MKMIRRAEERGHADHGWLDARHSFSFASYHDPDHMGFRALRVLNEDRVAPGRGFGEHPHQNMEIVTVVLDGALEHKDSMGFGSVIRPGDVQAMTAGTGVYHSEFNHSKTDPVHLLQIWVIPESTGSTPAYDEHHFEPESMQGQFALLASGDGRGDSIRIGRDVSFWRGQFEAGATAELRLQATGRYAWVQIISGTATLDGEALGPSDAVALSDVDRVTLEAGGDELDVLVIDLD